MAIFSIFDLIVSGMILIAFTGAMVWLLVAGHRHEKRQRRRNERWHHAYFREGGLVRALMARWSSSRRLSDRRDDRTE